MASKEVKISLNEYGFNLSSRLLAKEIISNKKNEIATNKVVVLDFLNVKYMSYSFATEFVDYFYNHNIEFKLLNQNKFIDEQMDSIIPLSQKSKNMAFA